MAINFLNTVDFNKNQLDNVAIQNLATDPGTGVEGQIYFNTAVNALKIYAGGTWEEVGSTSGVETFTNSNGTYVANSIVNTSAIGDVNTGTIDLTAVDGTSTSADRFLTKNNKWATIPFGDITDVNGGTYITTSNSGGPVVTVNHDSTSRTNTTSNDAPGYNGTFTALDSIITNSTGHVTGVNTKTITIPASDDTTYTLSVPSSTTNVRLASSDGVLDDIVFSGTTGQTTASRINASEIRIGLAPSVSITNDLTVGGKIIQTSGSGQNSFNRPIDMNSNKLTNVGTGTASTDGVNLGQVELLVAGVGVFQGGYNAATNSPALEGSSNVALDQGDYFVVSVSGTFLGEALEPGDFIFANNSIPANSTPNISNYTVVQADENIAGAGATDGATQKGVAGFDSDTFTVTSNGFVELKPQSNPYAASVLLTGGVDSGGQTTFTIDVTSLFGAGALAKNCITQVVTESGRQTVYPDSTGNGVGSLDFKFMPVVADSLYRALITIM
jgi:hypothetical protein